MVANNRTFYNSLMQPIIYDRLIKLFQCTCIFLQKSSELTQYINLGNIMEKDYKEYLSKKVEQGLKDIDVGRTVSWEKALNQARQSTQENKIA